MSDAADPVSRIRLHESWKQRLLPELLSPQMQALREFLRSEMAAGKEIYPPPKLIFNALDHTPFERVKVVILGQDPYHGPGQAQGLCFSVPPGIEVPPSLVNIYKELETDIGFRRPEHGCLLPWARQGVLLLNSVLTVQAGNAASHQGRGWEQFTDEVVKVLNDQCENLVFLLWGSYAQRKGQMIDADKHLVLKATHPSPMAANRGGFFGCRHFSQANAWLEKHGLMPIDWALPA